MATSDEVRRVALQVAERGEETDAAVREIFAWCGDHRVSVVRARQTLTENQDDATSVATRRAIKLLDLVLERGNWG